MIISDNKLLLSVSVDCSPQAQWRHTLSDCSSNAQWCHTQSDYSSQTHDVTHWATAHLRHSDVTHSDCASQARTARGDEQECPAHTPQMPHLPSQCLGIASFSLNLDKVFFQLLSLLCPGEQNVAFLPSEGRSTSSRAMGILARISYLHERSAFPNCLLL